MTDGEHMRGVSSQLSPLTTLGTAHQLLVKWEHLQERKKLWEELQTAISIFGKAVDWQLPARLRLVAAVLQVVEALASSGKSSNVGTAVFQWLRTVQRQERSGIIDPLTLLWDLDCCTDGATAQSSAASSSDSFCGNSADLESQVVAAARVVSSYLDTEALEKALMQQVVAKSFQRARLLIDELEVLAKYFDAGVAYRIAESDAALFASAPSGSQPKSLGERMLGSPKLGGAASKPAEEPGPDDEDTLLAMMEMGAEAPEPAVAAQASQGVKSQGFSQAIAGASASASSHQQVVPQATQADIRTYAATPQQEREHGQKRKTSVFDDPIEDGEGATPEPRTLGQPGLRFEDKTVPVKSGRSPWNDDEVERLIAGHQSYGNAWEHIRKACGLNHRKGTAIRDKWVNLVKAGRVRDE